MDDEQTSAGMDDGTSSADTSGVADDSDATGFAEDYERFKASVETRFGQVGDAFAALGNRGSTNAGQTEPSSAPTPSAAGPTASPQTVAGASAAQATPPISSAGGVGTGARSHDTKRPKSNHWWFRDAPWKRDA